MSAVRLIQFRSGCLLLTKNLGNLKRKNNIGY